MALTEKEILASYSFAYIALPQGILDLFSLVKVEEKESQLSESEQDTRVLTDMIWSDIDIHLTLEENDNRTEEQKKLWTPNGYTEPTVVQDFPIRDRRVFLHIKRRRWLDENGKNRLVNLDYPIVAKGIKLSPQFAAFLKDADGQISSECAASWGLLQS